MEIAFLTAFLAVGLLGFITNLSTLIYILKSFDINIHVFALIFIDSFMSTSSAGISTVLDIFVLSDVTDSSFLICSLQFLTCYLPNNFGALLTLIIASVRFVLAKKSAKNIIPSNFKVLAFSLAAFFLISLSTITYFSISIWFNLPYAYYVEACSQSEARF